MNIKQLNEQLKQYLETKDKTNISKKYPDRKRIEYEDDIVVVYGPDGELIYKGMEDYEPMKYEDWTWDNTNKYYILDGYIKICIL